MILPYVCDIWIACTFCKKFNVTKSESPYHATTYLWKYYLNIISLNQCALKLIKKVQNTNEMKLLHVVAFKVFHLFSRN